MRQRKRPSNWVEAYSPALVEKIKRTGLHRHKRTSAEYAALLVRSRNGETYAAMGSDLGVSRETIRILLLKARAAEQLGYL